MIRATVAFLSITILCATAASAQQARRDPHVGYIYPAGGERGGSVQCLVGGQMLNRILNIRVSGEGVKATVIRNMGRAFNLNGDERREVLRLLVEANTHAFNQLIEKHGLELPPIKEANKEVKLPPNHPLLSNLDKLTVTELEFLVNEYLIFDYKKQPNAQIGETLFIEMTIDPNAAPGDREIRFMTAQGLTNPLRFQVGALPETRETEPITPPAGEIGRRKNPPGKENKRGQESPNNAKPDRTIHDLPVVINGQITPGDTDRFRFRANEGQDLVIEARARHLIPFLADAVPGWFQATLAIYDADGREVAYADDKGFNPDPVIACRIPKSGEYEVEIRDALHRGRQDFVYRISIDGKPPDPPPRTASDETEPNPVDLPCSISGRIGTPGDTDTFRFKGKAGDEVVVEVNARRAGSPLDSLVKIADAAGRIVAWNDDFERKEGHLHLDPGLLTHHADSHLRVRLPADGVYDVRVSDAQRHGGEDFFYHLRISSPQPDFALCVAPSAVNLRSGLPVPVTVIALREDGFDGEIALALKDAPSGFAIHGGVIPAGRNSVRITMTTTAKQSDRPIPLRLEGTARIGGTTVAHEATPCDDVMQAFLYRHIVPAGEFLAAVIGGGGRIPAIVVASETPVRLTAGGTTEVSFKIPQNAKAENFELKLLDPPAGVTLQESAVPEAGLLKLTLKVDAKSAVAGGDNLIVEILVDPGNRPNGDKGKPTQKRNRVSAGVLPAIPFTVLPPVEGTKP